MTTRYIAVKKRNPIQVKLKSNITASFIDSQINLYGTDFIGIYETYADAVKAIQVDYYLFGNDVFNQVDTIHFLERCYNLEYTEG